MLVKSVSRSAVLLAIRIHTCRVGLFARETARWNMSACHSVQRSASLLVSSLGFCEPGRRGSSWREIVIAAAADDLRDVGQLSTKWRGSPILDCLPGRMSPWHTLPCQETVRHSCPKLLWLMLGSIQPPCCYIFLNFLTRSPSLPYVSPEPRHWYHISLITAAPRPAGCTDARGETAWAGMHFRQVASAETKDELLIRKMPLLIVFHLKSQRV